MTLKGGTMPPHLPSQFVQITGVNSQLIALDEHGGVWMYISESRDRLPFWLPLTDTRAPRKEPANG